MHILILNYHPLQSQFIQRALRYERIGADIANPHNLAQIWYGQYDAIVAPVPQWDVPLFIEIQKLQRQLGQIPVLFTSRVFPPEAIDLEIRTNPTLEFVGTHLPFHQTCEALRKLITESIQKDQSHDLINLAIADIRIDRRTHAVKRKKKAIHLRNREFALLTCFMENANKVLTRTFLLESAWDRNTNILSNTVDVHVSRLRRKIDDGFAQKRILTIPCIGYKLIA